MEKRPIPISKRNVPCLISKWFWITDGSGHQRFGILRSTAPQNLNNTDILQIGRWAGTTKYLKGPIDDSPHIQPRFVCAGGYQTLPARQVRRRPYTIRNPHRRVMEEVQKKEPNSFRLLRFQFASWSRAV